MNSFEKLLNPNNKDKRIEGKDNSHHNQQAANSKSDENNKIKKSIIVKNISMINKKNNTNENDDKAEKKVSQTSTETKEKRESKSMTSDKYKNIPSKVKRYLMGNQYENDNKNNKLSSSEDKENKQELDEKPIQINTNTMLNIITNKESRINNGKKYKKNEDNFHYKLNLKKGYYEKGRRQKKKGKSRGFKKNEEKKEIDYFGGMIVNEEIEINEVNDNIKSIPNNTEGKIPYFSEGYLNKEYKTQAQGRNISTPQKSPILTQKLSTIFKTNNNKKEYFQSAIRTQCKELKNIIHNEKNENEGIEKKLFFSIVEENESNNQVKEGNLLKNNFTSKPNTNIDPEIIDDFLTDEEVNSLEDEILLKVLEDNFSFKTFLPCQLNSIKHILNSKSCLTVISKGKGLCYQLPSLVFDGFTVYISPYVNKLHKHLLSLPDCLSGACLTGMTSTANRMEILDAIKEKKIKILFLTPERFIIEYLNEAFKEIRLICIDEPIQFSCIIENNVSFQKAQYFSIQSIIKENFQSTPILLLSSISDNKSITSIMRTFQIEEKETNTSLIQINENNNEEKIKEKVKERIGMMIFKEEEAKKNEMLKRIIKSQYLTQNKHFQGQILIICNFKKKSDEISFFLNQNSCNCISYHSGKTEQEKQSILFNFNSRKVKILVTTSQFLYGISKENDVKTIIFYDIPSNESIFLAYDFLKSSITSNISNDVLDMKYIHGNIFFIISDEDYYFQRNLLLSDYVDKDFINKVWEYILSSTSSFSSLNQSTGMRMKRSISNTKPEFDIDKHIKKIVFPITFTLSFSSFHDLFDGWKKNYIILYFSELSKNQKLKEMGFDLEILGIVPCIIGLRFYNKSFEETVSSENDENLSILFKISKETNGVYKFNTLEACLRLNLKPICLLKLLYDYQVRKVLYYEAKEEGMIFSIKKVPLEIDFSYIIDISVESIMKSIVYNINKLDFLYVTLRNYTIIKSDILKNERLIDDKTIKCVEDNKGIFDYVNLLLTELSKGMILNENVFSHDFLNENQKMTRPILMIESQKEKSNLSKDIMSIVNDDKQGNSVSSNLISILKLLFGISTSKNNFHISHRLWGSYKQYDYFQVYDYIKNVLEKMNDHEGNMSILKLK